MAVEFKINSSYLNAPASDLIDQYVLVNSIANHGWLFKKSMGVTPNDQVNSIRFFSQGQIADSIWSAFVIVAQV